MNLFMLYKFIMGFQRNRLFPYAKLRAVTPK